MRLIDADELITNLKRLESEYLYADGNFKEYAFVYGTLTGIRQAITYAKNTLTMDVTSNNKWISVEDRFPVDNTDVLIYRGGFIGDLMNVYTYSCDNEWIDEYGCRASANEEGITHWMPLPEPPSEEDIGGDDK